MSFFTSLMIAIIAAIYLGDRAPGADAQTAETQRPRTLFSVDTDYESYQEKGETGLWESSFFEQENQQIQYRMERRGSYLTVAKSCTFQGQTVVAQATLNLHNSASNPNPSATVMIGDKPCHIELDSKQASDLFIKDKNLIFTGSNGDSDKEFTVLLDDTREVNGVFSKIKG